MRNFRKGFAVFPLIFFIVTALLIGGGAYYYFKKGNSPSAAAPGVTTQTAPVSETPAIDEKTGWKIYSDVRYGVIFEYPPEALLSDDTGKYVNYSLALTVNVPFNHSYNTWTKKFAFIGVRQGKCDPPYGTATKSINSVMFNYGDPGVSETSIADSVNKIRNYQTENKGYCYVIEERLSGLGPASADYPKSGTAQRPPDLDVFLADELAALDKIVSTFKFLPLFTHGETENWKEYVDGFHGFGIKYPSNWFRAISGGNLLLGMSDLSNGDVPAVMVGSLERYGKSKLEDIFNGTVEKKINFGKDCKSFSLMGVLAYDCPSGSPADKRAVFFYNNGKPFAIYDDIGNDVSREIVSTFAFLPRQKSSSATLPAACRDEIGGMPIITSLSAYSGSVGDRIEINGCNFSGFEGDKNAWIEDNRGVKGILYGEQESTSKLLKVVLKSPLCQKDTSYSGLPCDAFLTLSPEAYKIYVTPWGNKSNEATFTIK